MFVNNNLIILLTIIYLFSSILYLFYWFIKKKYLGFMATIFSWIALGILSIIIILRWRTSYIIGIGHVPLTNLFESLFFFCWGLTLIYLLIEFLTWIRQLGFFIMLCNFFILFYTFKLNSEIKPLLPALKSNWLIIHVVTCFLGYSTFTVSFVISLIYLFKRQKRNFNISQVNILFDLIYRLVFIGFIFLTVGIITGSVWASLAWGSYWTWDPKETWSFITWLIYAILLHCRFMKGWQDNRIAILSLIGFICMIFTYLGVNYLGGLHSYTLTD